MIPLDDGAGTRPAGRRSHSILGSIVGLGLGPVIIFVGLFWLSRSWYLVDLSGIPDEGQVPAQLLPWFLVHYRSGGAIWSDSMRVTVWVTASLAYALPAVVALSSARSRNGIIVATTVVGAIVLWACVSIPSPPAPSEAISYFTQTTVFAARAWIVGLAAGGALLGAMLRLLRSRRGRGIARAAPDATTPGG